MKTIFTLCLAAALVGAASGQGSATDFFNQVAFSGADGEEGSGGTADQLVQALEADEQVTVTGPVELGEITCAALDNVVDAASVSLTIHGETIVADQTSYSLTDAGTFDDTVGRHVWTGLVSDPEQADDEALPRTVSLSWGEECTVETFLLKITKRNTDGTTTVTKTVPCINSTTTTCVVEVLMKFDETAPAVVPDDLPSDNTAEEPTGRRMQENGDYTVIDVMVVYTTKSREVLGGVSHAQMITYLLESLIWTNQAFINSEVALKFHPSHIGPAPYDENDLGILDILYGVRQDDAIMTQRNVAEADLVQVIAHFDEPFCGVGFTSTAPPLPESYAYSLVKPTCLDNYVHTHEYGHNMGCLHNRESTLLETEYAHGLRYCDGLAPYRTIMSYSCGTPYGNYFSNPDVSYLGRPTGTATEDNARAIEDVMVAVSNYRGEVTLPPSPTPAPLEPPTPAPYTPVPTPAPYTPVPTPAPYETPSNYASFGCYADSSRDRVLTGSSEKGVADMTTEYCADFCQGYAYFGTEYRNECFCGSDSDDPTRKGAAVCDLPCSGDKDQTCGGDNAISVYEYITYPFVGCFKDSRDRVLSGQIFSSGNMTTEMCAMNCEGSPYFGTEFGVECFCGVDSDDPDELGEGTCNFPCAGDESEICGGSFAISVYQYPDVIVVPPRTFLGCYTDSKRGRIMTYKATENVMTTDYCQSLCSGYPFFGTQYGIECWCGDDNTDYTTYGESTSCDMECAGDDSQTCGGFNAMSVWEH